MQPDLKCPKCGSIRTLHSIDNKNPATLLLHTVEGGSVRMGSGLGLKAVKCQTCGYVDLYLHDKI